MTRGLFRTVVDAAVGHVAARVVNWAERRHPRQVEALESAAATGPVKGWVFDFTCHKCGTEQHPEADEHGSRVELIRWTGEPDPGLRWVLRCWCDECDEPTLRDVSEATALLWRDVAGVYVHDLAGLPGDTVLALLEEGS